MHTIGSEYMSLLRTFLIEDMLFKLGLLRNGYQRRLDITL
jgi:hypothetical protein